MVDSSVTEYLPCWSFARGDPPSVIDCKRGAGRSTHEHADGGGAPAMMRLPCNSSTRLAVVELGALELARQLPVLSPFPHPCRRVSELKASAVFPPRGVRETATRAHCENFFVFLLPTTQHTTMSSGVVLFNQRPLSGGQLGGGGGVLRPSEPAGGGGLECSGGGPTYMGL